MIDEVERTLVDVGGVRLAVASHGTGADTIFMFHGVTANQRVWKPIQDALAMRFTVVSVDQRGHGFSDRPPQGYEAIDFSDDIRGLVDRVPGTGRKVLVGHSLGARNVIVTAARFPELIDGIVAIDFTPFIEAEVIDALAQRVAAGDRTFGSVGDVRLYLRDRYRQLPVEAINRRTTYGYEQTSDGWVARADAQAMVATVSGLRADLAGHLAQVRVPAVIVRGAESTLVTEQAFEATRKHRPDLDYRVVSGADHYVPEEQPDAITRIVTEFINTLN